MIKKFLYYLNPRNLFRRDKEAGIDLRVMHGINKISIMMFVLCLIYMTYESKSLRQGLSVEAKTSLGLTKIIIALLLM